MESASEKKRRGRPSVYAKVGTEDIRDEILKNKGERATQNELYIMDAISAIERLKPAKCELIYFFPVNGMSMSGTQELKRAGCKRDSTILEQLGRAITQDELSDADFMVLAEKAAAYKEQGYTSKEIAKWIRQVRAEVKENNE